MAEAQEMDGLALVGKIKGRNPTQRKMEDWVKSKWIGLQGEGLEITPLAEGSFGFRFSCREDTDLTLRKVWTYGKTPFQLKRCTPLFDAETEKLDTIPVWVRLPGLPWEF